MVGGRAVRAGTILGAGIIGLLAVVGCQVQPATTRIELTTYDEFGAPEPHYADFPRAFYHRTRAGLVELMFEVEQPSTIDPSQTITQIVCVREIWKTNPGKSFAEATQINAAAQYAILSPPTGIRYDGTAFVTYKLDEQTGMLTGEIESGTLMPRYRMGETAEPFGPVRMAGTFRAAPNAGAVLDAQQRLEDLFRKPIRKEEPK